MTFISGPRNVQAGASPIWRIDQLAKASVNCLTSTYQNVDAIMEFKLQPETPGSGAMLVQAGPTPGAPTIGGHRGAARFQAMTNEQPTGFSAGYMWL